MTLDTAAFAPQANDGVRYSHRRAARHWQPGGLPVRSSSHLTSVEPCRTNRSALHGPVLHVPATSAVRSPEAVVERAYARIGLIGNPSDGFNGKTISVSIQNYYATVCIRPAASVELVAHAVRPRSCQPCCHQRGLKCNHGSLSAFLRASARSLTRTFSRHLRTWRIGRASLATTAACGCCVPLASVSWTAWPTRAKSTSRRAAASATTPTFPLVREPVEIQMQVNCVASPLTGVRSHEQCSLESIDSGRPGRLVGDCDSRLPGTHAVLWRHAGHAAPHSRRGPGQH